MMENLMQTKDNSDDTLGLMLETAQVMQKTSLCPLGQSAYPMLRSAVHYFGDYLGTHQEEDI
jgi:NADH:ubiquinone oxidoreductase subunit F (NADH-binding)